MATANETQTGKLTVAVSGSSGLVGSALCEALRESGHSVRRVVRHDPKDPAAEILWDPDSGKVDADRFSEVDAVVHLAGENIVGRWNEQKKRRIRSSRVEGTRILCEALAGLDQRPGTLVCASAIGYYGDRGDDVMTEDSPPGEGFLAEVCQEWEGSTRAAQEAGIRVVNARLGVVLSARGGALAKMLTPFRLGGGGIIGSGRQYMSWIALGDVVAATEHLLATESCAGPVNLSTPNPVTNREFTKTLGRLLRRPTIFPMPAFAARLVFGEMADEMLLASTRVAPVKLRDSGYEFQQPELEAALRHVLSQA